MRSYQIKGRMKMTRKWVKELDTLQYSTEPSPSDGNGLKETTREIPYERVKIRRQVHRHE